MSSSPYRGTVLVTGANGFIGNAVAKTFAAAGFKTYGLVRRESALQDLAASEVVPILGSPGDTKFLSQLLQESPTFDVLVSCTEQIKNYVPHYEEVVNLLCSLATASNKAGVRPLVLFTSGCKDYGRGTLVDDPALHAHTEESPLNPEPWAKDRANNAIKIFNHGDLFDAALFRPVTLYGYTSSYYGGYFDLAEKAKKSGGPLEMPADPRTVLHGMHVQDVAEAYLAVASAQRDSVKGQCFNLSGKRYETIQEIADRLVEEYSLEAGVKYVESGKEDVWAANNARFTQWVGSEKIRGLLGWEDKKPVFTEGIHIYRIAYEASLSK